MRLFPDNIVKFSEKKLIYDSTQNKTFHIKNIFIYMERLRLYRPAYLFVRFTEENHKKSYIISSLLYTCGYMYIAVNMDIVNIIMCVYINLCVHIKIYFNNVLSIIFYFQAGHTHTHHTIEFILCTRKNTHQNIFTIACQCADKKKSIFLYTWSISTCLGCWTRRDICYIIIIIIKVIAKLWPAYCHI